MQSHRNQELDHPNQTQFDSSSLNQLPSNHWQQHHDDNNWIRLLLSNNTAGSNSIINSSVPPSLPPLQTSMPSLLQSQYYPSISSPVTTAATVSSSHLYQSYATLPRSNSSYNNFYSAYNRRPYNAGSGKLGRSRLTTTLWEDESTLCYQIDCQGICVARRQDNNMINGTKLLNVAGMSRGKRDGILKNERGRIVVKVGAMHLKGVWIPFVRAKALANQFKIADVLHPIFSDDPTSFLYPSHLHQMNRFNNHQSSYKPTKSTYRGYYPTANGTSVAGTTALELLTNSNRMQPDTTSVIIDHTTTNDTYGIYNSHSKQQTRTSHHSYYDQPDQATTTATTTTTAATDIATTTTSTSTDSLNSASFDSTDYSTAPSCSNMSVFQRGNHSNSRENEVNLIKPVVQPYCYSNNDGTTVSNVEDTTKASSYFSSLVARRTPSPNHDNSTSILYQQPTATISSSSTSSSSLSSLHPDSSKLFW